MAKPSELFLSLWHFMMCNLTTVSQKDFLECAEAWQQIRVMEIMLTTPEPEKEVQIDQHTYEVEETDTSSVATATASPQGEAQEERDTAEEGQEEKPKSNRERKQEIRDRILTARKNGISTQSIADAAGGQVTDDTIYQIINAMRVDIRTYERIARGLDELGA